MKSKIVMGLMAMVVMATAVMGGMYRIDSQEVVYDSDTKLLWQDNSDAATINKKWNDAINYCENLTFAGHNDWVLPSLENLKNIVDKFNKPTIKQGFENTVLGYYWTSDRYNDSSYAKILDFNNGNDNWHGDHYHEYIRCVRSGQLSEPLTIEIKKKEEAKRIEQKHKNAWSAASSANTLASYKEYLKNYPNGEYASSAKSRIESIEYENKYSAVLSSKDPQSMYLAAVKYENKDERGRSKKIYLTIMDNFEKSPMAVKAADRLAALSDVEAVESSNRANQNAIKDATNQKLSNSRQQCENNKKACLAGCGIYISGADSHNNAVWSCNDKCKQISCY